jgi:broad specificity phosphatase PhoE
MTHLNQLKLTIVWIRHAEKTYSNNRGGFGCAQHDPEIKAEEFYRIKDHSKRLISRYGHPQLVFTSPYKRTRQTTQLMISEIEESLKPEVHVDSQIAEYLGYQDPRLVNGNKSYDPDVDKITSTYDLPKIKESTDSMMERIKSHISMLTLDQKLYDRPTHCAVIWVVTHGIIISRIFDHIYKDLKGKMIHNFDFQAPWSAQSPHPLEGITVIKNCRSLTMGLLRVPRPKKVIPVYNSNLIVSSHGDKSEVDDFLDDST